MDRMDRPRADAILGVPPAIAIDRKDPVRTSRSTVGTMTELTDYVKLLFARQGVLHCDGCGRPVQPDGPERSGRSWCDRPAGRRWSSPFRSIWEMTRRPHARNFCAWATTGCGTAMTFNN
jgi:excinuclease UvrABC ATPase subunit